MDGRRGGQRGSCNISGRVEFRFQILGVRLVRCFPGRSRTSPKGTTTSAPACRWGPRWGHPGPTCERAPPTPPPPRAAPSSQCPRKPGVLVVGHDQFFFPSFDWTLHFFSRFDWTLHRCVTFHVPKGPRKGHSRLLGKHGEVSLDGKGNALSFLARGFALATKGDTSAGAGLAGMSLYPPRTVVGIRATRRRDILEELSLIHI